MRAFVPHDVIDVHVYSVFHGTPARLFLHKL